MSADLRLTYMMVDLGILQCADQQKIYLRGLLTAADAFLRRRGVTLDDNSDEDDLLVGSVAAWMYRARQHRPGVAAEESGRDHQGPHLP